MARVIDLDEPLSDEDRQYLVDRCRWAQLAQADGLDSPKDAQRQAEAARKSPPGAVPAAAPTVVAGPAEPPPPSGADPLADKPYSEWPYAALQEELKARKIEAVDDGMDVEEANVLFAAGGKQGELVARLEADDKRVEELEAAK